MRQFKKSQTITDRGSRSIDIYLSDISKIPMLSVEEEVKLAESARRGDSEAIEKLVTANLRFVVSIANSLQGMAPIEDLISEGNAGLIKAASLFDPSRGFRFISYAVWWIRQSMIQYIQNNRTIRMPQNVLGACAKLSKVQNQKLLESGTMLSLEEAAEELGNELTDKQRQLYSRIYCVSGDASIAEGSDCSLFDTMSEELKESSLNQEDQAKVLNEMLFTLSARDSRILKKVFGIGTYEQSFDEIALQEGLSRERVRQIVVKGITKLRKNKRYRDLLRVYL